MATQKAKVRDASVVRTFAEFLLLPRDDEAENSLGNVADAGTGEERRGEARRESRPFSQSEGEKDARKREAGKREGARNVD
jgi:hypothetical protein